MARQSLAALFVFAAASCIVTSTPNLTDPPQEPPYLVAAGATPDPQTPLQVTESSTAPYLFSATVVTHDANEVIWAELLIDYGFDRADGLKAFDNLAPAQIAAGSLVRRITMKWYPFRAPSSGCHTVTMLVSHQFDPMSGCPLRGCDSSQITWFVQYNANKCLDSATNDADRTACLTCPPPMDTCPADLLPPDASPATRAALSQQFHCPADDDAAGAP